MLRREFMTLASALVLAASAPNFAMAATPGDQFVIAVNMSSMRGLDPHELNQLESAEVVANLYERLIVLPADNIASPEPGLAESWTVSDDGKTFTFKIRSGVTFHSGNTLTAKDVEWSLRRLVKLGLAPSTDLRQWGFSADNVDTLIRATDDQTLELKTPELWNADLILLSLASFSTSILDSAFLADKDKNGDMGREYLQTADAGSGPYSLRTWRANELLIADAFKDYWQGAPAMRRVLMRHLPESSAQRLQIEAGDLDVATRLSSTDLAALDAKDDVTIQKTPGFGFYYLALNQKDEILGNPKVREAFRYLIDYDGLAGTVMKYYGIKQQTIIPAGLPGALTENPYKLDIDKAKQLLAEAGYPDGFSKVYYATPVTPEYEVAQSLQANAAKAGIKLDLQGGDHIGKFRERAFELFSARSGERLPDPHAVLASYATNRDNADAAKLTGLLAWRTAWDVPAEIQEMVTAAAHETDKAKRAALYESINRAYLESSPPLITSFQRTDAKAVRGVVKGYLGHSTWLTRWDTVTKGE
ncbi:ABC transporter substrate-binding protein [Rhizobium sp. SSA_523]|uniref:ABC transporter substrate-binding protein n=1 Tax=Rhizobium sp. SSA_523 TaxID=2952477 RepID=UPI0020904010|nr:ABC transporter substrate-binding protein [Rhizobium sp. SSA_523]MCO5731336.1 ABC transporter substrate-binding protein [Rhizobium sp. SSA_523]WKC22133.1 ABC transporter substrate-binding protein [Rhizobium sp. SSA_523]